MGPDEARHAAALFHEVTGQPIDMSKLESERQWIEQSIRVRLLPLIYPAPKNEAEQEELVQGLVVLQYEVWRRLPPPPDKMEAVRTRLKNHGEKVAQAAALLRDTGHDSIAKELEAEAEPFLRLGSAGRALDKEARMVARAGCIELCRGFLQSRGKQAGVRNNPGRDGGPGRPGRALLLAKSTWELVTSNPEIDLGEDLTEAGWAQVFRRHEAHLGELDPWSFNGLFKLTLEGMAGWGGTNLPLAPREIVPPYTSWGDERH